MRSELLENVSRQLPQVAPQWLAPAKPIFQRLVALALDEKTSDQDFETACRKASEDMPGLFGKLKTEALQDLLEAAMGSAAVNGVVNKWEQTQGGRK